MQEVSDLKTQLEKTTEEIEKLTEGQANDALLFSAYDAKLRNDTEALNTVLSSINYEQLTEEQKAVYDKIQN
jgi:hypothetical protein